MNAPDLAALIEPELTGRAVLWRAGPGWRMLASTVLGGGLGERGWVLNAQVPSDYDRLDPDRHLRELAAAAGLTGDGVGMLTAADVSAYSLAGDGGVQALATVAIGYPTWAAAPPEDLPSGPGTINLVVAVPAALTDAALVNAVATATEAKVQAVLEAGYACTGTASDAICVASRVDGPSADFAGPRSHWGSRLARAVHAAVRSGALGVRGNRADTPGSYGRFPRTPDRGALQAPDARHGYSDEL